MNQDVWNDSVTERERETAIKYTEYRKIQTEKCDKLNQLLLMVEVFLLQFLVLRCTGLVLCIRQDKIYVRKTQIDKQKEEGEKDKRGLRPE